MNLKQKSLLPLILATAFLDLLGFSLFIPVLPDITAHFGQAESWTMWTQSIYSLGMFVAGAGIGNLSDRYGRRNLLLITTVINIVGYIITYVAITTQHNIATFGFGLYLFARLVSGIAGSGFGVIQAYISDISTSENRSRNMGLMGAAFGSAFLVGPALGGILAKFFGIDGILLFCITVIFINLVWIYFGLPEPQKQISDTSRQETPFSYNSKILFLLALSLIATIGFSVIQTGSTQYSLDRFGFSADWRGYTLTVVGITSIIFQGFLVKYIRKLFTDIGMMLTGLLILTIGMFLYVINPIGILVFIIVILFPLGMGMFTPSLASQLAETAPHHSGKIMGLNTSMTGIGGIIGPLFIGILYAVDITLPFWVSMGLFTILFIVAFWYFRSEKKMYFIHKDI